MKIDHLWLTSKRPLCTSRKYVFMAKVIVLMQNLVNALLYLGDMDVLADNWSFMLITNATRLVEHALCSHI